MEDFLFEILELKGWGTKEELTKLDEKELKGLLETSIINRASTKGIDLVEEKDILHGKKVLIVDDKKVNLIVTRTMLNKLEVDSEEVTNGPKALEYFKTNDYDMILLDINMPEMNGYEVLKMLKAINKETPVIALTAEEDEKAKFIAKGFDEYVAKPIKMDRLRDALIRVAG